MKQYYISLSSFLNFLYPLKKNRKAMELGISIEEKFKESLEQLGINFVYNPKLKKSFLFDDFEVIVVYRPDFIIEELEIYEVKKANGFLPEKYFNRILLQAKFYSYALNLPAFLVFVRLSSKGDAVIDRIMPIYVEKRFEGNFKSKLLKYLFSRLNYYFE